MLAQLGRGWRTLCLAARWPLLLYYIGVTVSCYLFPLLLAPLTVLAASQLFWWVRVTRSVINPRLSKHPGATAPPLVTADGTHKDLWGLAASPLSLSSFAFLVLVLSVESTWNTIFSTVSDITQRLNPHFKARASEPTRSVQIGDLILETSLSMSFARCTEAGPDKRKQLVFEFGDVYFPLPTGALAKYTALTATIDLITHATRTFCQRGDEAEAQPEPGPEELTLAEAGFLIQFFLSHGSHVTSHIYGTWASRIPSAHQDECTFWMANCSDAMLFEGLSWGPTFVIYGGLAGGHFWDQLPSANMHTKGLLANLRFPSEHAHMRNADLVSASNLCRFIMALRVSTKRAFAKYDVRYDPEVLLAAFVHALDHYAGWAHRVPSCFEFHGVDLQTFWITAVPGPLGTFVDTKLSGARLHYLQDIYHDMRVVDKDLAEALHFCIAW